MRWRFHRSGLYISPLAPFGLGFLSGLLTVILGIGQVGLPHRMARSDPLRGQAVGKTRGLHGKADGPDKGLQGRAAAAADKTVQHQPVQKGCQRDMRVRGQGVAQGQRAIRGQLHHQALGQGLEGVGLLGIFLAGAWLTRHRDGGRFSGMPGRDAARRIGQFPGLAVFSPLRGFIVGPDMAAIDHQPAVGAYADKYPGARHLLGRKDHRPVLIRLERRLDRQRRHRRGAGAQRVEQVFGQVAGRDQGRQAHEAGAALDRVEGTEDRVQRFLVFRVAFEAQQMLFNIDCQIHRLDDEILEHIVH